jgi:tetratricopeptide (TPR) repeat protein
MRALQIFSLILVAWSAPALADASADCNQHRDQDLSMRACTALIGQDPRNAMAYYNRGAAHGAKKDYDAAIADFTKAIEINPQFAAAYRDRGLSYVNKKDGDRAIADYTKVIEINPKDAIAYCNRNLRRLRCFRRELAPMRRVGDAISRLLNDLLFFCASGIARGRVGWGEEWRAIDRRPLAPYFDFRLTSNSSAILAARKNAMPPACAGPRAKGSLPGGTPYTRVRIRLISATNFFAERLGDLLDI